MDMKVAKKQSLLGKFVEQEVIYNVSGIVYELAQSTEHQSDIIDMGILSQDDWLSPAEDDGYEGTEIGAQDYCTAKDLEPYQNEALEHWIVSERLADRLEEQGEMIIRDFYGMTIWGRTTSGQAILLDGVIERIYDDMQKVTS